MAWAALAAQLGITGGLWLLNKWLQDNTPPRRPVDKMVDIEHSEIGSPIPIVFGTVRVDRPLLVGEYNPARLPNADGVSERFGATMLFIVGTPPARTTPGVPAADAPAPFLRSVFYGDKQDQFIVAAGGVLHGNFQTAFLSFGGDGRGGHFCARVEFYDGRADQLLTNFPSAAVKEIDKAFERAAVDRSLIPGYRHQMVVAVIAEPSLNNQINQSTQFCSTGEDGQVQGFGFEITANTAQSPNGPDANPAWALFHLLCDPVFKIGLPLVKIDVPSFQDAATKLVTEGNGCSFAIQNVEEAPRWIDTLLDQIDGALFFDPATRTIKLKLIRKDYVVNDLRTMTIDNTLVRPKLNVTGWRDCATQVQITYTSRNKEYKPDTATAQRLPNAVGQDGRPVREQISMPGVTTGALAQKIATRELAVRGRPRMTAVVKLSRDFFDLLPGDPIKASWPQLMVVDKVFRVVDVDIGQLADGGVIASLIEDVFDTTQGGTGDDDPQFLPTPKPIIRRVFSEAPRWLQLYLVNLGILNDADVQRVLSAAKPSDASQRYSLSTAKIVGGVAIVDEGVDIPARPFPFSAKVLTAYGRDKAPYDTTTGLVITSFYPADAIGNTFFTPTYSEDDIENDGHSLILVNGEIMAYESATDLGGSPKQWRLNNVWRELLDTRARDHAVGDNVFWLAQPHANRVGSRGWNTAAALRGLAIPQIGSFIGFAQPDAITVRKRCLLPARVASLELAGKNMLGTQGVPATAGQFAKVTLLEEGVDVFAFRRDRKTATIVRGELADETLSESVVTFAAIAQKVGGIEIGIATLSNAAIAGGHGLVVGAAGHGEIDFKLRTRRQTQAGEGTFPTGTFLDSWDTPTVRMTCPTWRNLLANSRFDYTTITPGWAVITGQCGVGNDSSSIPRDTTGFYFKATGTTGTPLIRQIVDVTGYLPRKMTARLVWYQRNLNVDTNDTATVTLEPYDVSNNLLSGSVNQTLAGNVSNWERQNISIASLPANTVKLRVDAQLNEVATGGSTTAESALTEFELILGQHLWNVLANDSFETGTTASWTNVTNSFVVLTEIGSPSANYAQGGAFASSEIRQDYTLVTGWEVGSTVVLRCWRAQRTANDTGRVILECLDGGSSVLASADTGAENLSTLNQWVRRRLSVTVPVGTVTIRVRLLAVRSGGAGNSGAVFDELVLSVHKDLDPAYEKVLKFDAPSVHPVPATWQDWILTFPTLFEAGLMEPVVFAGEMAPSLNRGLNLPLLMRWSDDVVRTPSSAKGQFGNNVTSVGCYKFTRQSGSGALDFQSTLEGTHRFLAPTSADAFTVIVEFRIDEPGFSTACGLVGRRDGDTGWELSIDASGHVSALLEGQAGIKTATRPSTTVHDGAWHLAAIVYDPAADTLTVYDERGGTSVSTASGMGEIAVIDTATPFRIGRGRSTIDTIPGLISRVKCFPGVALSSGQITAQWNYGKDPNATALVFARNAAVWVPTSPDVDGEALVLAATDQIAIGWDSDLTGSGGTGLGIATSRQTANLCQSFDFTDTASWIKDASTTLTQGVIDATGLARGVTVLSPDTSNGFKAIDSVVDATATITVVFWAKSASGTPQITLDLMNASDVNKQSLNVTLDGGTSWKRYITMFNLWDGSTGTCRIRFRSQSGSTTFSLTHAMAFVQSVHWPSLIPLAGATLNAIAPSLAETLPRQFNAEAEIVAVGVAISPTPGDHSVLTVHNGTDNANRRDLIVESSDLPRFQHYDSAGPTNVTSTGSAIDWTQLWTIRGRWCSLQTLDNASNAFAGIVVDGNVDSAVYGRAATWTYSTTQNDVIELGGGPDPTLNAYLRSVTIRAREQKLV